MEVLVAAGLLLIFLVVFFAVRIGRRDLPSLDLSASEGPKATQLSTAAPSKTRSPEKVPKAATDLSSLLPVEFIVLDLETTGLSPYADEIIEIGAIRASLTSDTHATFQYLVKPTRRIPKRITEITGITQAMVDSEGVPIRDALTEFAAFIGDLRLVTFNAQFDIGFLCTATSKEGIPFNNRYTCALKRARRAWPGLPSYKLKDLARMGNLSVENSHRALGDCTRALVIFTSATSKLGQKVRWNKPMSGPGARATSRETEPETLDRMD
jgi:DNA polymerase III epsilon subunit family exonuclease